MAGLLKAGGWQRTDATHVVASVRTLSRRELVGGSLRAALEELAEADGDWLPSNARPCGGSGNGSPPRCGPCEGPTPTR